MPAIIIPKDINDKIDKVEPYLVGCHLRDDAPEDIKKLDKEIDDWFGEQTDGFM